MSEAITAEKNLADLAVRKESTSRRSIEEGGDAPARFNGILKSYLGDKSGVAKEKNQTQAKVERFTLKYKGKQALTDRSSGERDTNGLLRQAAEKMSIREKGALRRVLAKTEARELTEKIQADKALTEQTGSDPLTDEAAGDLDRAAEEAARLIWSILFPQSASELESPLTTEVGGEIPEATPEGETSSEATADFTWPAAAMLLASQETEAGRENRLAAAASLLNLEPSAHPSPLAAWTNPAVVPVDNFPAMEGAALSAEMNSAAVMATLEDLLTRVSRPALEQALTAVAEETGETVQMVKLAELTTALEMEVSNLSQLEGETTPSRDLLARLDHMATVPAVNDPGEDVALAEKAPPPAPLRENQLEAVEAEDARETLSTLAKTLSSPASPRENQLGEKEGDLPVQAPESDTSVQSPALESGVKAKMADVTGENGYSPAKSGVAVPLGEAVEVVDPSVTNSLSGTSASKEAALPEPAKSPASEATSLSGTLVASDPNRVNSENAEKSPLPAAENSSEPAAENALSGEFKLLQEKIQAFLAGENKTLTDSTEPAQPPQANSQAEDLLRMIKAMNNKGMSEQHPELASILLMAETILTEGLTSESLSTGEKIQAALVKLEGWLHNTQASAGAGKSREASPAGVNPEASGEKGLASAAVTPVTSSGESANSGNNPGNGDNGKNSAGDNWSTLAASGNSNGTTSTPIASSTSASSVIDQIANIQRLSEMVRLANRRGLQQISLQFSPPELGKVHIRVESRDGVVSASFRVETAEAAAQLRDGLAQLKENLRQVGIEPGKLEINQSDLSGREFGTGEGRGGRENSHPAPVENPTRPGAKEEEDKELARESNSDTQVRKGKVNLFA
ncbi:MAG: flagellar hook-length control protein FliK [Planctomycetota bacterium]|jgi:flagellar hook-length control protein FliK|nr:flagellar hook-length control protein FliK [Planctomycetota bacterium]